MSKVLYLSHGGGPLPLLKPKTHENMIRYYQEFGKNYTPKAIVVISAHMEREDFTVVGEHPKELLYDYSGFPIESYSIEYNPPIDLELTDRIFNELSINGVKTNKVTDKFDHGVYIPLTIMYPKQNIPVIQISLKRGLNEQEHINLGKTLGFLKDEDVLFIGSGSSFHNLRAIFGNTDNVKNNEFHDALIDILTKDIPESTREELLVNWRKLPNSIFSHPRSEHLIPLLVCYGIKQSSPIISFDDIIMNKRNICALW
ncbi:MAG: dioxygenase [Bacilli bacterium]|nr:dioxygenase [Bacilli bacterium]